MNRHALARLCIRLKPKELGDLAKLLFRIRRATFQTGEQFRMHLDPASLIGQTIMAGDYESQLVSFLKAHLRAGDTFVDVGANEGFFSMLAHSIVGPGGQVLAFEPQERLWSIIAKNIALNQAMEVQLLPFAISDTSERVLITLQPSTNTGASSMVPGATLMASYRAAQSVSTTTLDSALDRLCGSKRISILKIDIEGYEGKAIRSASRWLSERRFDFICVEYHPQHLLKLGESCGSVETLICANGYRVHGRHDLLTFYAL